MRGLAVCGEQLPRTLTHLASAVSANCRLALYRPLKVIDRRPVGGGKRRRGQLIIGVSLLEGFRAGDGTANGGGRVINIGCSAISNGSLDYFDREPAYANEPPGTPLGAKEGNIRFGSSKLLMSAAMYALRRSLVLVSLLSPVTNPR